MLKKLTGVLNSRRGQDKPHNVLAPFEQHTYLDQVFELDSTGNICPEAKIPCPSNLRMEYTLTTWGWSDRGFIIQMCMDIEDLAPADFYFAFYTGFGFRGQFTMYSWDESKNNFEGGRFTM